MEKEYQESKFIFPLIIFISSVFIHVVKVIHNMEWNIIVFLNEIMLVPAALAQA